MKIYNELQHQAKAGRKQFAVLIDPDKSTQDAIERLTVLASSAKVDFFFVGGSLVVQDNQAAVINHLKNNSNIPVVLFPGNNLQLNNQADSILLLSLISGRNPDLLIGRHVITAPYLRSSNLEIIPTGYILVESGRMTTVMYMSNTMPVPGNKPDIAACTAMAGEMLGLKLIYLDAGSGAASPVPPAMISAVKKVISVPLVVGGGITSPEMAITAWEAGADIVVVGNAIEQDPQLIPAIAKVRPNSY